MERKWLRIDEKVPTEGQLVFFYFGHFDKVYAGKYVGGDEDVSHYFVDPGGWLGDDVTYWMPREKGDYFPSDPSDDEKAKDRYHPRIVRRNSGEEES